MAEKIAICSMFNNSLIRRDLFRFIRQIEGLHWPTGDLRVYCVEGDSRDHTWQVLQQWAGTNPAVYVHQHHLGHQPKGSVEDEDRMIDGSMVGGGCRARALRDGWADRILWTESDLIWGPDLIERLMAHDRDIVVPWIPIQGHGNGETDYERLEAWPADDVIFYDTWAYRLLPDGSERIGPFAKRPAEPFELYSAGSCLLAKTQVVAVSNLPGPRAIVGRCEQARAHGYQVWCDPTISVWHRCPKP